MKIGAENISDLEERLYNITTALDYDQPTSLESDMDLLADGVLENLLTSSDFKPTPESGYLAEVLEQISPKPTCLTKAISSCEEINNILGNVEYGSLDSTYAKKLEIAIELFIEQFNEFIRSLT